MSTITDEKEVGHTMKLLPCPHCGGKAGIGHRRLGDMSLMFAVGCDNCRAGFADKDSAEAIARWNKRVDSHDELVAAAEKVLAHLEDEDGFCVTGGEWECKCCHPILMLLHDAIKKAKGESK
jgi:Lar family restriction alleviation protein